jgi:hypothetical protein
VAVVVIAMMHLIFFLLPRLRLVKEVLLRILPSLSTLHCGIKTRILSMLSDTKQRYSK